MKIEMMGKIIGYRLIYINNSGFKVEKDGDVKHFDFITEDGDCCGYSDIETKLYTDFSDDISENPIITNIEFDSEDDRSADYCLITFFGLDKKIAEVNSVSGSGSGWCYGAYSSVRCRETKEEECITAW